MPVATWRRPVLAPVYALVTAFILVVGIGVATGARAASTLRIDAGAGADITDLAGSVVEVRDPAGLPVAIGELSPQGTYELPDKAHGETVCLWLPARWQVTKPAMAGRCTAAPLSADFTVTVTKEARVTVAFTGPTRDQSAAKFAQTKVSVRNGAPLESGPPDASGHYQPRGSLSGNTVCVTPPSGWSVQTPPTDKRDAERCMTSTVSDPHNDITFTLEESGRE